MRRAHASHALVLLSALMLGACASEPVPELAYYSLAPVGAAAQRSAAVFKVPITINAFLADGVYNEQGVLYQSQQIHSQALHYYHSSLPCKSMFRFADCRCHPHRS